jgi:hypothetical protein
MTEEEIQILKQLNCLLFNHGYARVKSLTEWEERVRTDTVRKPCPRRIMDRRNRRWYEHDLGGAAYHGPPNRGYDFGTEASHKQRSCCLQLVVYRNVKVSPYSNPVQHQVKGA